MLIPCLQDLGAPISKYLTNFTHLFGVQPVGFGEGNRLDPEFCIAVSYLTWT
ncbi:MAG: hypothetical protein WBY94_14685 [Polyangiaceae bacterium]